MAFPRPQRSLENSEKENLRALLIEINMAIMISQCYEASTESYMASTEWKRG